MNKLISMLTLVATIFSCQQAPKESQNMENNATIDSSLNQLSKERGSASANFNINEIPISSADLGDFPFINLPLDLKEMNKPLIRPFDICYFPIQGIMTAFEGKLYKTNISAVRGKEFSQHFFEKSMADYLQSLGATKIYDGEISKEEFDRYNKLDPNKGDEGDIGYFGQNIKFWVIRNEAKGNIYVQYHSNNASAALNILQEDSFEQTITKVTAKEIINDFIKNGKSILYINFDIDKSSITEQGEEIVEQIAEALNNKNNLKVEVHGHTDDTGDATHNKNLSYERANSVIQSLVIRGIDKDRLTAKGYGAEKPLAENNTEENKSKNRRVELVSVN